MVKNQAKIPHFWLWYFDKKGTVLNSKKNLNFIIDEGELQSID
jgi:hypothetical protein